MKKIAWNEEYFMYVYFDWKFAEAVKTELNRQLFTANYQGSHKNDDTELRVIVTPANSCKAHAIISNIIQ